MKKIILILLLFTVKSAFGQGNLQLNSAKFIEYTVTTSTSLSTLVIDQVFVVTQGKMLKIESVGANSSDIPSGAPNLTSMSVTLNDVFIFSPQPSTNSRFPSFPIWLPEGSFNIKLFAPATSTTYDYHVFISGLEFNIVP